jgi:hypothetical protein
VKFRAIFALSISILLLSLPTQAQPYSQAIYGIVRDSQGEPIPSAVIHIVNQQTGSIRVVVTNAEGEFTLPLPLAGSYRVEITEEGFQKHKRKVNLLPNQKVGLKIRLRPPKPKPPVPYIAKSR